MAIARVVSLVPSATETICRLGAAERLVGCTRYCTEPAGELGDVARVGGTKNPKLDRILQLAPDLVVGNSEENRPEDLAWLAARCRVLVSEPRTVRQAADGVRELAQALALAEAAMPFLLAIEAQLARAAVLDLGHRRCRVFYPVWRRPWMSANATTYVHDLLACAGADNVCADLDARYPEVDEATVRARRPDVVLLPSEPWAFTDDDRLELAASGAFGADVPLLCVDGRDFCWHGAHTADGLGRALDLLLPCRRRR